MSDEFSTNSRPRIKVVGSPDRQKLLVRHTAQCSLAWIAFRHRGHVGNRAAAGSVAQMLENEIAQYRHQR